MKKERGRKSTRYMWGVVNIQHTMCVKDLQCTCTCTLQLVLAKQSVLVRKSTNNPIARHSAIGHNTCHVNVHVRVLVHGYTHVRSTPSLFCVSSTNNMSMCTVSKASLNQPQEVPRLSAMVSLASSPASHTPGMLHVEELWGLPRGMSVTKESPCNTGRVPPAPPYMYMLYIQCIYTYVGMAQPIITTHN